MRKQTRYLDVVEEGNPIRIASAARWLVECTPMQDENFEPEEEDEEDRRERVLRDNVKGMRLDTF
jgi:hypothetical protein